MNEIEIEIFRAGKHVDANGAEVNIEIEDLDKIIKAYDTELHEAPLVIGHPQHDEPAWGWVASLKRKGKVLLARLNDLSPEISQAVRKGHYKKISASFYRPNVKRNPVADAWYLRHIGLLGAQTPAVKGLSPLKFSEDDKEEDGKNIATFSKNKASILSFIRDKNNIDEKIQQENVKDWQEILSFVEAQIACGKILPHSREETISFIANLDTDDTMRFREANKTINSRACNSRAWFYAFVEAQPQQIDFSVYSDEELEATNEMQDGVKIGEKASEYMQICAEKGKLISAADAVKHVTKIK